MAQWLYTPPHHSLFQSTRGRAHLGASAFHTPHKIIGGIHDKGMVVTRGAASSHILLGRTCRLRLSIHRKPTLNVYPALDSLIHTAKYSEHTAEEAVAHSASVAHVLQTEVVGSLMAECISLWWWMSSYKQTLAQRSPVPDMNEKRQEMERNGDGSQGMREEGRMLVGLPT